MLASFSNISVMRGADRSSSRREREGRAGDKAAAATRRTVF
jgi:hypothetical protein